MQFTISLLYMRVDIAKITTKKNMSIHWVKDSAFILC